MKNLFIVFLTIQLAYASFDFDAESTIQTEHSNLTTINEIHKERLPDHQEMEDSCENKSKS